MTSAVQVSYHVPEGPVRDVDHISEPDFLGGTRHQGDRAAERGLVGCMQTLANGLAPEWIGGWARSTPPGVVSGMTQNEAVNRLMAQADEATYITGISCRWTPDSRCDDAMPEP